MLHLYEKRINNTHYTNIMDEVKIEKSTYDAIAKAIHSDKSPVGIDAKKTHVLILEKLIQLEKRMKSIEEKLDKQAEQKS